MAHHVEVSLDRLVCTDTESVHSSDNFFLVGAVTVDGTRQGFAMPGIRINDYETRRFPDDLRRVFDGISNSPEITVELAAWDVDQNAAWVDHRETIAAIAKGITLGLTAVGGKAVGALIEVAKAVVDQLVAWDKNDPLLAYTKVLSLPFLPGKTHDEWLDVPFAREENPDYAGFDYTLSYYVGSTTRVELPEHEAPRVRYVPAKGSASVDWINDWTAKDLEVSITRAPEADARPGGPWLAVRVEEVVGGRVVPTRVSAVTWTKELLGTRSLFQPGEGKGRDVANAGAHRASGLLRGSGPGTLGQRKLRLPGVRSRARELSFEQVGGDHLALPNGAVLELYRMVTPGSDATTPALRYVRPADSALRALDPTARDVLLHPRRNL